MSQRWVALLAALALLLGAVLGIGASELLLGRRLEALAEQVATLELPSTGTRTTAPRAVAAGTVSGTPVDVQLVSVEGAPLRGDPSAPITIVEFSDFQCPFCARVHSTLQTLLSEFRGQVRLAFRHNPLPNHSRAPMAHKASIAASRQGRFWEMHDRIFDDPRGLDRQDLLEHARELGLDVAQFERDLADPELEAVIERDLAQGRELGVRGTPTFFINGRLFAGAQPIENFRTAIARDLARLANERRENRG